MSAAEPLASATVLRASGGVYDVELDDGTVTEASLRGRLKLEQRTGDRVVPGDVVHVTRQADGGVTIESVDPRTSELARRAPGRSRRAKIIVANMDRVVIVFAAAELMENVAEEGESVDLLVNNAGFGLSGRFHKSDPQALRQMIDLNCGALTDLCRMVLPEMVERRSGAILNVASTAAFQPGPGIAVYFATKAYVLSLSEALHEEVRRFDVCVSALCPGPTRTEFAEVAGLGDNAWFDRFSMDADAVVRAGLDALDRNKAIAITGVLNKVGAFTTRLVPRALTRKIAGKLKP